MLFNFFKTKTLLIPKEDAQKVTELESFTVKWGVLSGWSSNRNYYHKVFIKREDAEEFEKQLKECARFLNTSVTTELNRN